MSSSDIDFDASVPCPVALDDGAPSSDVEVCHGHGVRFPRRQKRKRADERNVYSAMAPLLVFLVVDHRLQFPPSFLDTLAKTRDDKTLAKQR